MDDTFPPHCIEYDGDAWCCLVCGWAWACPPRTFCLGVLRLRSWDEAPPNLWSASMLKRGKLKAGGPPRGLILAPGGIRTPAKRNPTVWRFSAKSSAMPLLTTELPPSASSALLETGSRSVCVAWGVSSGRLRCIPLLHAASKTSRPPTEQARKQRFRKINDDILPPPRCRTPEGRFGCEAELWELPSAGCATCSCCFKRPDGKQLSPRPRGGEPLFVPNLKLRLINSGVKYPFSGTVVKNPG